MHRFHERGDEGWRENRNHDERQWVNRGDVERGRGDPREGNDWRDDPEAASHPGRRFGPGYDQGGQGSWRDELEDWQQPRDFGRDTNRGSRGTAIDREQSAGRFDRPYREESDRQQGLRPGRFGRNDSSDRFGESSVDPRRSEHDAYSYREGSQVGQHWRDHASRSSFGDPNGSYGGGHREVHGEDRQSGQFRGKGPKGYRRSDERIREDLCDRLTSDPRIDGENITVNVSEGVVTLEGTVPSRQMKRAAEDLAEEIMGVGDVTNTLRVGRQDESAGSQGFSGSDRPTSSPSGATATSAKSSTARNGH